MASLLVLVTAWRQDPRPEDLEAAQPLPGAKGLPRTFWAYLGAAAAVGVGRRTARDTAPAAATTTSTDHIAAGPANGAIRSRRSKQLDADRDDHHRDHQGRADRTEESRGREEAAAEFAEPRRRETPPRPEAEAFEELAGPVQAIAAEPTEVPALAGLVERAITRPASRGRSGITVARPGGQTLRRASR